MESSEYDMYSILFAILYYFCKRIRQWCLLLTVVYSIFSYCVKQWESCLYKPEFSDHCWFYFRNRPASGIHMIIEPGADAPINAWALSISQCRDRLNSICKIMTCICIWTNYCKLDTYLIHTSFSYSIIFMFMSLYTINLKIFINLKDLRNFSRKKSNNVYFLSR